MLVKIGLSSLAPSSSDPLHPFLSPPPLSLSPSSLWDGTTLWTPLTEVFSFQG